ncbi:MAG: helix-turn-helix domain-containing protein [Candidatus Omnitrophota bacterium]
MKEKLISIGFSEKDAEIYLALIRLEKASIADLMKKTSIERRTIYDVLDRLIQRGWASYFEENGRKYYLATSPEIILKDLEQKNREFEKIIPELTALNEKSSEAKVEILKGVKGLRTIFLEIIHLKEMHYAFGNIAPFISDEKYTPAVKEFLEYLEGRGIKERIIYPKGEPIKKIKGGQYKEIAKELIPPTPTILYGDVTAQFIFTDPITIIKTTSKEITNTNRKYFDTFWRMT